MVMTLALLLPGIDNPGWFAIVSQRHAPEADDITIVAPHIDDWPTGDMRRNDTSRLPFMKLALESH